MKKLLIIVLVLASCKNDRKVDIAYARDNITYFKDPDSGLCFGLLERISGSGVITSSLTCVPCDSLKPGVLK